MNKRKIITLALLSVVCLSGCKKFLDEKTDKSLTIPVTIADFQAMLDNNNSLNGGNGALGEGSADNYYLTDADWASLPNESNKNNYIWESELFFTDFPNMWTSSYYQPYVANVILDGLEKLPVTSENVESWNNIKGSALYFRARAFYNLAVTFAPQYDPQSAATDLGIPLRLNPDFNEPSFRASVQQNYNQVIADLKTAIQLLPATPLHTMRPSRPSAYAMLARTYLAMRQYINAGLYADSALQLTNTLVDYNTLNAAAAFPVPRFNPEVLFHSVTLLPAQVNASRAKIDSTLYASYAANDLRKVIFFKNNGNGSFAFKGSYNGSATLFDGVTTSEMYLVKAECLARDSNRTGALAALNALMMKRWKTGTFNPFTATSSNEALIKILAERRKELLMRDLRWMDLKRLNKEQQFAITIRRKLNNQVYELPPNDNRYALPFPDYVIQFTGMPQNPR